MRLLNTPQQAGQLQGDDGAVQAAPDVHQVGGDEEPL